MDNNKTIIKILKKSKVPISAYEILDKFNKNKAEQPMTIYRALNRMQKDHIIHKCNQSKKFFLCNHKHLETENLAIMFCNVCGKTSEFIMNIKKNKIDKELSKSFDFSNYQIEISTTCMECK